MNPIFQVKKLINGARREFGTFYRFKFWKILSILFKQLKVICRNVDLFHVLRLYSNETMGPHKYTTYEMKMTEVM